MKNWTMDIALYAFGAGLTGFGLLWTTTMLMAGSGVFSAYTAIGLAWVALGITSLFKGLQITLKGPSNTPSQ